MTYADISLMFQDGDLRQRITAAAAQEGKGLGADLQTWVDTNIWTIVASPGWEAAWASAVANDVERPGWDAGVISDGMILAAVQPIPAMP